MDSRSSFVYIITLISVAQDLFPLGQKKNKKMQLVKYARLNVYYYYRYTYTLLTG